MLCIIKSTIFFFLILFHLSLSSYCDQNTFIDKLYEKYVNDVFWNEKLFINDKESFDFFINNFIETKFDISIENLCKDENSFEISTIIFKLNNYCSNNNEFMTENMSCINHKYKTNEVLLSATDTLGVEYQVIILVIFFILIIISIYKLSKLLNILILNDTKQLSKSIGSIF